MFDEEFLWNFRVNPLAYADFMHELVQSIPEYYVDLLKLYGWHIIIGLNVIALLYFYYKYHWYIRHAIVHFRSDMACMPECEHGKKKTALDRHVKFCFVKADSVSNSSVVKKHPMETRSVKASTLKAANPAETSCDRKRDHARRTNRKKAGTVKADHAHTPYRATKDHMWTHTEQAGTGKVDLVNTSSQAKKQSQVKHHSVKRQSEDRIVNTNTMKTIHHEKKQHLEDRSKKSMLVQAYPAYALYHAKKGCVRIHPEKAATVRAAPVNISRQEHLVKNRSVKAGIVKTNPVNISHPNKKHSVKNWSVKAGPNKAHPSNSFNNSTKYLMRNHLVKNTGNVNNCPVDDRLAASAEKKYAVDDLSVTTNPRKKHMAYGHSVKRRYLQTNFLNTNPGDTRMMKDQNAKKRSDKPHSAKTNSFQMDCGKVCPVDAHSRISRSLKTRDQSTKTGTVKPHIVATASVASEVGTIRPKDAYNVKKRHDHSGKTYILRHRVIGGSEETSTSSAHASKQTPASKQERPKRKRAACYLLLKRTPSNNEVLVCSSVDPRIQRQ